MTSQVIISAMDLAIALVIATTIGVILFAIGQTHYTNRITKREDQDDRL